MNTNSRTANSLKNISTGLVSQLIQTALGFISRTIFVKFLAVEYLGINGLFSSILSVLAFAELGIGSAFVYSLYKPLADKNEESIASILKLYRKAYSVIGIIVFVIGLFIFPFLDLIIEQKPETITESIQIIYLIFLFNAASTYFFSYKVSLLNADQRNYVTNLNYLVFYVVQNLIQIAVLYFYKDFLIYLITQLILQFLSNVSISILVNKYYPFLKKYRKSVIDNSIKKELFSNAKATLIIKIGGIIVNNTDNLIINYFSGLVLVGLASNYNMLLAIAMAFIAQIFNNVSASIAQVNVKESKSKQLEIFKTINLLNMWVYGLGAVLFFVVTNDFIDLWIGNKFLLPQNISLILAINFFMLGVQTTIWTFKSTYGFFNEGKYLVLGTAALNLLFSFYLGEKYGLLGILMATAISRLLTNFWYDPYIVFKLGLKTPPVTYLKRFLKFLILIITCGSVCFFIAQQIQFSSFLNLILKSATCFIIVNATILLFYKNTTEIKTLKSIILNLGNKIVSKVF